MRKKILLITLLIGVTTLMWGNETKHEDENKAMLVNDLAPIPFPGGKMFKSGKIVLSDEQKENFATTVRPIMHEKYNPLIQEIFLLEKSTQRAIKNKENFYDEKFQQNIDKIANLKKEALGYKIEALIQVKTILTPEQWQVWVNN